MSEDSPKEPDSKQDELRVNVIGEGEAIPVYNCMVIISRLDNGEIHGQVANLDDIEATAKTEREILEKVVKTFKKTIGKYLEAKQPIPWLDSPMKPAKDQVERLIPVHL